MRRCMPLLLVAAATLAPRPQPAAAGLAGAGRSPTPPSPRAVSRLLVAWSPANLPAGVEGALDRLDGVRATTVFAGLEWVARSRSSGGEVIDDPPPGYAIPVETAVIEPHEYARLLGLAEGGAVAALEPGQVLLSETSATLREGGRGIRLTSYRRTLQVTGVVPDSTTQGYEAVAAWPVPGRWPNAIRFVIVRADNDVSRARIRAAIRDAAGSRPLRLRSETQTPFLRYADAVRPQASIKRAFGEFAADRIDGGRIAITGRWLSRRIVTDRVPILGDVTCHRRLFAQLRGALRELRERGLAHLVRRDQYAGCYNARFIATIPGTRLSRHSWGVAVDLNTSGNAFGAEPHQDPRLVRTMRRWGFTWGGTWPIPDGMHFEWTLFAG
ncbi:MAG: M15 family metallopeptidase [Actinomycetota bacterium]